MSGRVIYDRLSKCGRLGNELFQIASTYGLAYERDMVPAFNADWIHRPYFSLPDEWFEVAEGEYGIGADDMVPHIDPRAAPYLQDVTLFHHLLPELRTYLAPSDNAQRQLQWSTSRFRDLPKPVLGVHVRRGDNLQENDPGTPNKHLYHRMPPLAYYQRAIEILAPKAASIAVFSDDPAWCAEHLLEADYVHYGVPRPKEHEATYLTAPVLDHIDFFMLAQCDYHVVTGSTFGIWAALLADSQATVYAWPPYGPKLAFINANLLFMPHWQRLGIDSC